MRRRAALLAILALAGVGPAGPALARCEGHVPQARPQNTARDVVGQDLDQIVERGFVEFALYEAFPPWSYVRDGRPAGVDVELARLIADALGVEPRFRLVAAGETLDADLMNYVWKGAVVGGRVSNVMMHVPYDSDYACRVEQVVFTGLYAQESIAIAYRRDDYPDDPPVPAYFRFDTVAVENDSISDFYLSSLAGGQLVPNIRRYPSAAAAMEALARHEVMAAMAPRAELEAGLTAESAIHAPPLPGFSVGSWTVGVAVHQAYRALGYAVDDAIRAAAADGRIAAIFAAEGIGYHPPEW